MQQIKLKVNNSPKTMEAFSVTNNLKKLMCKIPLQHYNKVYLY